MQKTKDKQEIYELSCKYARGLDRLDSKLFRSVFFDDAFCEYGFFNGNPDEFTDFCMNALKEHESNHHMIGNVLIEIKDKEAFGEVYFNAYHKVKNDEGEFEDIIIAGRYIDRYKKRQGQWKFIYRSELVDWSRTQLTKHSYFDSDLSIGCRRGGRQNDPLYDKEKMKKG